jgi:hypothetical protein
MNRNYNGFGSMVLEIIHRVEQKERHVHVCICSGMREGRGGVVLFPNHNRVQVENSRRHMLMCRLFRSMHACEIFARGVRVERIYSATATLTAVARAFVVRLCASEKNQGNCPPLKLSPRFGERSIHTLSFLSVRFPKLKDAAQEGCHFPRCVRRRINANMGRLRLQTLWCVRPPPASCSRTCFMPIWSQF